MSDTLIVAIVILVGVVIVGGTIWAMGRFGRKEIVRHQSWPVDDPGMGADTTDRWTAAGGPTDRMPPLVDPPGTFRGRLVRRGYADEDEAPGIVPVDLDNVYTPYDQGGVTPGWQSATTDQPQTVSPPPSPPESPAGAHTSGHVHSHPTGAPDPSPAPSAPDPAPYNAPDPGPSAPSYDPGPSTSYDGGSSGSSSDSGSSSW